MIRALAISMILAGCSPADVSVLDQCMRVQIFNACLDKARSLQSNTVTNGPSDVVSECQSAATYNSYRKPAFVKPECRP